MNHLHKLKLFAISAALAANVSAVDAANVTADVTIDLGTAITGTSWTGFGHALGAPVQVSSGDTVTINIGFAPGQGLAWAGDGTFNPWLMLGDFPGAYEGSQSGSFSWSNLSVSFLNLTTGTQFGAAQLTSGSSSSIHLGPTNNLTGGNIAREFSGVTLSFLATWTDGDPFREYGTFGYSGSRVFGGTVNEISVGAVPLPAGGLLLLTSLAGIGLARRRRGRQS